MTLDLLDAPLRLTWDLHHPDGRPTADPLQLARALTETGVFFVTLEQAPLAHPEIGAVLSLLADGGCRCLLVCGGSATELQALEAGLAVHGLFLDAGAFLTPGGPDLDALGQAVEEVRARGHEPSLLLTPRPGNLRLLPQLLAFCRQRGIGRFKLPNLKIDASFWHSPEAGPLRPDDLDSLRRLLESDPAARQDGVALEVHDLFLWELLLPAEGRSEYGGCQAANSLAHLDAAGNLHPCSSWPQVLGSVLHRPITEIWQSPERLRVREEVAMTPAGCAGCADHPLCLGGCRGLGRAMGQSAGERDPLCRGPRRR